MTKVDRRTIKTREAINQALLELMTEKDFDAITINDISLKANIHRGTVYLHYSDKYDLLAKAVQDHLGQMLTFCVLSKLPEEKLNLEDSLLPMFLYFETHFLFYFTVLSNKGTACFKEQLIMLVKQGMIERLRRSGNYGEDTQEVAVQYMLAAYVGVVEWWITNKMPLSPRTVAGQLWDMLEHNYAHHNPLDRGTATESQVPD